MSSSSLSLRSASLEDQQAVRRLHEAAFGTGEGKVVADLAVALLKEEGEPRTWSMVAEQEGQVTGHVAFSPVWSEEGGHALGYLLAPLAVHPDRQKSGVGSALIREGMKQLEAQQVGVVLVYGDPAYYGRFGFTVEAAAVYLPPHPLSQPMGWQACPLGGASLAEAPVRIRCVPALSDPSLW